MNASKSHPLYRLRRVRKTYGVRQIPPQVFRECRLDEGDKPLGPAWRQTCGLHEVCRQECPRCWALSVDEMEISRGCTTAILGHSGSGKTTLLYLLAMLHEPDPDVERFTIDFAAGNPNSVRFEGGSWVVEGAEEDRFRPEILRRERFGFIFQAGYLSSHLTTLQNVALAPALAGTPPEIMHQRAESLLRHISFPPDRHHALPRHLSGGEYQRVAVARALAADPNVLFADEPTGNLDPVTGRAVMELLGAWQGEQPDRSLILVTHNLEHALDWAEQIFVLNGGEVALAAPRSAIQKKDIEQALEQHIKEDQASDDS